MTKPYVYPALRNTALRGVREPLGWFKTTLAVATGVLLAILTIAVMILLALLTGLASNAINGSTSTPTPMVTMTCAIDNYSC